MERFIDILATALKPLLLPREYVPADKQMHFWGGLAITLAADIAFDARWGFTVCCVVAFGKEAYDWLHKDKHTPDIFDTLATICGGVVGFFLLNTLM